ncbi:hypothetical protein BT93_B1223 [Corymbia citriodora subsp. variegata]|nr:hypothetical protein BT93_B1223 [Corymbia citriodora subsp. variegata]
MLKLVCNSNILTFYDSSAVERFGFIRFFLRASIIWPSLFRLKKWGCEMDVVQNP